MNEKKAIKICNWVDNNVLDGSPMLMLFLIFFGFGGIFLSEYFGSFLGFPFSVFPFIIPFIILVLFIFIFFYIEYRLKKNFNLEYDYLNDTYKVKK